MTGVQTCALPILAVIAKEQHLDLVIIDDGSNIKGLDITDAVKTSYRVQ